MLNVSLTQLGYIVALEDAKHFGAAARRCHVSQPTLSMQVQKLEDELGVELFDRSRQPIQPTEIGRKILAQARRALAEVGAIEPLLLQEKGEVAGEFRLGVIPTLAQYLLPMFVQPFVEKFPGVSLVLEEAMTETLIEKLRRDEIDAAIVVTPLPHAGLEETPLFYEAFWVYASSSHPIHRAKTVRAEDLDARDLWLLKEGHCFREQALRLCKGRDTGTSPSRSVTLESGSLEVLRELVDQGGGLTLLPELAVRKLGAKERSRVRPFAKPAPVREVSLVQSRRRQKKRIFDALETVIREALPSDLPQKALARQIVDVEP